MIEIPSPGIGTAIILALFALFFWFSNLGLLEWEKRLGHTGWIPAHLESAQKICRLFGASCAAFAGVALLPPLFDPLIPIAFISFTLLIMWSARGSIRDFAAGWLLQSEQQISKGVYIHLDNFRGQVTRLGFRTTTLIDGFGQKMLIPNRTLIGESVVVDPSPWPLVSIRLHISHDRPSHEIHRLLEHAVICSPWSAPHQVHIENDGTPHHWTVRTRILELHFEEAFAGALRDRVDELMRTQE